MDRYVRGCAQRERVAFFAIRCREVIFIEQVQNTCPNREIRPPKPLLDPGKSAREHEKLRVKFDIKRFPIY
eukprot:1657909-Pyramimonas_sp.AAC.1